jgi:hypothetical protein
MAKIFEKHGMLSVPNFERKRSKVVKSSKWPRILGSHPEVEGVRYGTF